MVLTSGSPPKVTVLMTLYNKGAFVEETVRSILASGFRDFELLVVDDASTDGGPEKVRALGDDRIRILSATRNTGRAAAANRGFDDARGEYIAVVDADDLVAPDRFAKQVEYLDQHPQVGVVGSRLKAFGTDAKEFITHSDSASAKAVGLFGMPVLYPTAMFRRSVLDAHGHRCDPDWLLPGMDMLFMLRVGLTTEYGNIQEPLTFYRTGEQNMRHGRDPIPDYLALDRAVFALFGIPATDEQLALHVHLQEPFVERLTADRVARLWAWVQELVNMELTRAVFSQKAFEKEIMMRWDRLYQPIAEHDLLSAITFLKCSGRMSFSNLWFVVKRALRRIS
ncbi:MAG: glycosyltransferase family 2 protein [Flavobacteriales bacterium]|nr:glycosyltransferase family 2 protein [Flavobacteriales bacterium]